MIDDTIDSRDIIARLEDLDSENQNLITEQYTAFTKSLDVINEPSDVRTAAKDEYDKVTRALTEWVDSYNDELVALRDLNRECEEITADWIHGEVLINEGYWVDYVKELCEDVGFIPRDLPHYIAIDWEQTAENISADYSTVDFDGNTYYLRNS